MSFRTLVSRIRYGLPEGRALPEEAWQKRHRAIVVLLWLHAVGLALYALLSGYGLAHALTEGGIIAAAAVLASMTGRSRKFRSVAASLGLVSASAVLVHLSGGYIEMHFHFFVMVIVISLYQDWAPFLLAIGFVVIHHGVIGVLDPHAVYNHPDAWAEPWKWAAIHGAFVLAASVASVINWRLSEDARARAELILNAAGDGIYGLDLKGNIGFVNPAATRMLGWSESDLIGRPAHDVLHVPGPAAECSVCILREGGSVDRGSDVLFRRQDGSVYPVEYIRTPMRARAQLAGAVVAFKDITERKLAEAQLQLQLQRLSTLHNIDLAIISSTDLPATLRVALDQTMSQLGADAADILLLDARGETLDFALGGGFRLPAAYHPRVRLDAGYAGAAARERRMICVPHMQRERAAAGFPPVFAAEGFDAYFAAPLIAKDQVKGVLEIFYRRPLEPGAEWRTFFEALATQVAIAIDNASLFDSLQCVNADLREAYDTTIEGWSRALDLRDHETEGHTLRVTEMALRLGRACGLSDADLVHLRRGALLHDIGKMGVPDSVLLKPGPLSADEWVLMKRHPEWAYELLAPVLFLRPALDVPYCHHERWDGTGYPRGLKGEEIPLAARLFAVIDVWDALRSDRPYRSRWPESQVRAHLRAGAGSHFDPRVVDQFLRVLVESAASLPVRTGPLSPASVPARPAASLADPQSPAPPRRPLPATAPSAR